MFADLIPEPSVADAYAQYIKNLTQFGFILAILLGMGAIVNEKERGTAAIILSKPLPRWAFILSKFSAQIQVYLLSFLVAACGGYYYTYFLFETVSFVDFMLVNLLMFIWILPIASATLFGSTLARSTGAAAGIGVGISGLILLAGNIPQISMLTPGGLVAWASQIGTGSTAAPNGGAIAVSIVLSLMFIISSLGIIERQEI